MQHADASATAGHNSLPGGASFAPAAWPWALESPPETSSERGPWRGALLRAWHGTSPVMVQPPLDQHYIVMHLGGAKHVTRRRDGPGVSSAVASESLTLVPAGTAYTWRTEGPIAFAHLYLPPRQIGATLARELDAEAGDATLVDRVGYDDPWLQPLFLAMLAEVRRKDTASTLRLDSLLESFCRRLALQHLSRPFAMPRERALAPHRLRRVLEFIDANFGRDIGLAELVGAAGSSQSHFSHAFHLATGCSPYRYLLRRRIEYAKLLLLVGSEPLHRVATSCGFSGRRQLSVMFRRAVGVGPKRFRTANRGA